MSDQLWMVHDLSGNPNSDPEGNWGPFYSKAEAEAFIAKHPYPQHLAALPWQKRSVWD